MRNQQENIELEPGLKTGRLSLRRAFLFSFKFILFPIEKNEIKIKTLNCNLSISATLYVDCIV